MLSKKQIEAELASTTGVRWVTDTSGGYGLGSLVLRINSGPRGVVASWFVVATINGRIKRHKIGAYSDVTPAQARAAYQAFDTSVWRDDLATGATVSELFTAYIGSLESRGARSSAGVASVLASVGEKIGLQRKASSVTTAEIMIILAEISASGRRRSADAARTAINAAYNWAMNTRFDYTAAGARDFGITVNPVSTIRKDKGATVARDRNLSADEIKTVWSAGNDVLNLILCCGQRVMETLRIEGKDVDLESGIWTQPACKTKGGERDHQIPLPRQAVEIITRLMTVNGDGYLFPPAREGKQPHLSVRTVDRQVESITGITSFQARDLRRTWKSRAGDAGIPRDMRDMIQQHFHGDTGTKFYDRYDYLKEKREAMKKWEEWLDGILY